MKKQYIIGLGIVVAAIIVGTVVQLRGTGGSPKGQPQTPATEPSTVEAVPTPEMNGDLGAASRVPEDVSVYASTMHLARRWQQVWESNAVQNLVALPVAQQFLTQLQQHPLVASFVRALGNYPLAVEGLPVLRDALSTEIFVCAGPEVPETLNALSELYGEMTVAGMRSQLRNGGGPPGDVDITSMIEAVLNKEGQLRVPSVLFGFRLTDVDAATEFLDRWIPRIDTSPFGVIAKRTIKNAQFHVLAVSGEQIPNDAMRQLAAELEVARVPADAVRRLVGLIRSQRVSVAVGVLDGYLLFSMGRDTSLLERWGTGSSLATLSMLEPVRTHTRDGLVSLSYTAASMASKPLTAEDVDNMAEYLIQAISQFNASRPLADRLRKDARLLVGETVASEPHATLSFTLENQGVESYTFGGPFPKSLDGSQSLSILAHRGKRPIVASAARAARNPNGYEQVVKWAKIAFGYFEDFAVVEMDPEDRARYEEVMRIAMPFLTSLDAATRNHLVPAVDGTQSLLLLDGEGGLVALPGRGRLPQPLALPRLGAAIELNDAEQFKTAMNEYAAASRKLIADIETTFPSSLPPGFGWPPPRTTETAGGTLYFYQLPVNLGPDVHPCALLKGRLLVLASSARLAEEMAGEQPPPSCAVIEINEAAGSVTLVELDELWSFLRRLSDGGFRLAQAPNPLPGDLQRMNLMKMQVDAVIRSLGALRSYRSTTIHRDGRSVQHSWLHVRDIGQ